MKKKVAFISGSSKGIGLAISKKLNENNFHVVLNSRKKVSKKNFKQIKEYDYILGDVTQEKSVNRIYKNFKKKNSRIDVLICNVGLSSIKGKKLTEAKRWKMMFDQNLMSAVNLINKFKLDLIKNKTKVVFISSITSLQHIQNAPIEYATIKAALNTYCKLLSKELGSQGVKCNNIILGNVYFKGSVWSKKSSSVIKSTLKSMITKKFITTDEVADLVLYLISAKSSSMVGSNILLDGGQVNNLC